MTDNKKLTDTRKTSAQSEKLDTVLAALRAGASLYDPLAGTLTTLATHFIPSQRLKRLEEYAANVGADLKALAARVDNAHLKSDQFAFMFEQCFRGAAENYQEEKLAAFRGILVNSAVRDDVDQDEQQYMLSLINRLTELHLRILSLMADPIAYLDSRGIDPNTIRGGLGESMECALPGIDIGAISGAFDDLHQAGMLNTDSHMFNTMTSAQGIQIIGRRVTEHGQRFIDFCKSPASQKVEADKQ